MVNSCDLAQALNSLVTQGQVDAAKELTADTRAVLHEFRNMTKTFDYLGELGKHFVIHLSNLLDKDVGVRELSKITNPRTGYIDAAAYLKSLIILFPSISYIRFATEKSKMIQNYGRIKLPFTEVG